MGYRDDFYRIENIIGYTGKLSKRPSVYFFSAASNAYGHITQAHGDQTNVGREIYKEDPDYLIENTQIYTNNYPVGEYAEHEGMDIKGNACVEWRTSEEYADTIDSFHTSRNLFIPVRPSRFFPAAVESKVKIAVCAIAIREFQNLKSRYG